MITLIFSALLVSLFFFIVLEKRNRLASYFLTALSFFAIISFYFNPIGLGSYSEVKTGFEFKDFFSGDKDYRDSKREKLKDELSGFVDSRTNNPSEVYMVAKRLKDIEEFNLSRLAYDSLYQNHSESLDGGILSEYAQILYFVNKRIFTEEVKVLLNQALITDPTNPSALTLKGLESFQEGRPEETINYWSQALKHITNENERSEIKEAIKALNKRKNQ
jgi:cytochrome c-type biogenesis protein CcmH/NrfG